MKRLVVVDDNQMMREFLRNFFCKDYLVDTYESAEEVMTAIRFDDIPHLMVVDYELAGLDGFELLKTLKSSGFYRRIPIFFLSGKSESDKRIACLQEGAEDFITKPFNPMELSLKIKRALN
ncbi:MAG: response regulator [Cyclobacteriaceae bacterium]|nr:response regulator [Cyclobacteriaceae bacterium HetDA_MAG_MS6]